MCITVRASLTKKGTFVRGDGVGQDAGSCWTLSSHLGLCLNDKNMVDVNLIRRPGASDLDWLDGLD